MNRYLIRVLVVTFIALYMFSCKSSRISNKAKQISTTQNIDLNESEPGSGNNEEIDFSLVDKKPMFNGDTTEVAFLKYIISKTIYPKEAQNNGITGQVVVEFVIDEKGSVTKVKLIRRAHPLLNAEAIRVVKKSPKWTPGIQKGKPVKVRYRIPLNFNLPVNQ